MRKNQLIIILLTTAVLVILGNGCTTEKLEINVKAMNYQGCMQHSGVKKYYTTWLNRNAFCKRNTVDVRIK